MSVIKRIAVFKLNNFTQRPDYYLSPEESSQLVGSGDAESIASTSIRMKVGTSTSISLGGESSAMGPEITHRNAVGDPLAQAMVEAWRFRPSRSIRIIVVPADDPMWRDD